MDILPKKDNFQRSEQELRLQPFTLISALLLACFVAGSITYTCVYSDTEDELIRHGLLSGLLDFAPAILFIYLWRKESKRPLSFRARKVAWKLMFVSYLVVLAGAVALAVFTRNQKTSRLHLITFITLGLPIGVILWRLIRSKESRTAAS